MKTATRALLALSLMSIGACTSIQSEKLSTASDVPEGLIYRLPATAVQVTTTYELMACDSDRLSVKMSKPTFTAVVIGDPRDDYAFVVDTREMTSFFKEVKEAKLTLSNGLLTGVNYEATDKTKDIVVAVVGTAASFGAFGPVGAIGIPAALSTYGLLGADGVDPQAPPRNLCNKTTMNALNAKSPAAKAVAMTMAQIKSTEAKLLKAIRDGNDNKDITALQKQLGTETALLESQKAAVSSTVQKALTHTYTVTFLPTGAPTNGYIEDIAPHDPKLLHKWLQPDIVETIQALDICYKAGDDLALLEKKFSSPSYASLSDEERELDKEMGQRAIEILNWCKVDEALKVFTHLSRPALQVKVTPANTALKKPDNEKYKGIYHRLPIGGVVAAGWAVTVGGEDIITVADSGPASFPQFGPLAKLTITNGIFQDNRYEVQFAEDGTINSFEYQEKNARALEAVNTISEAKKAHFDAEKLEIERETELINARIANIDAKNSLEEKLGATD